MRIWYQSFAVLERVPEYRAALDKHVRQVTRSDVEICLQGMPATSHAGGRPAGIAGRVAVAHQYAVDFVMNARWAEQEGYDAFAIAHFPDLGLRECRSVVDIPVVALGEATMRTACYLGDRIALICFIADAIPLYERNIDDYGLRAKAGPILPMSVPFDELLQAFKRPQAIGDRFLTEAQRAIEAGVDVIIPGEGVFAECLNLVGIRRVGDVPVMDGTAALIKACESLVDLRRSSGVYVNRRDFFFVKPEPELLDQALRSHGAQLLNPHQVEEG